MNRKKKVTQFLIVALIVSGIILLDSTVIKAQTTEKSTTENSSIEGNSDNQKMLTLEVKGMSCQAGCADGLDKTFSGMTGIIKSNTSFDNSSSKISYDQAVISKKEIIKVIQARGFKTKEIKPKE
tara:strand:- start:365 stop:739 length:375 start_codon:yes stop_codon:yes gene_type:complete